MTIMEMLQCWQKHPGMPEELLTELSVMDYSAAEDSFYQDLAFGTGGLRGVLGAGTNRMNLYTVAKATRGLGCYLKESFSSPSCAVSYDSRIHSRDFAELTSAVLADMGIRVFLYPHLHPTPMLSYAVRRLNCSAGVMITASHNPAKFNGYKVYGSDGCQITLKAADRIQGFIDAEPVLVDTFPDFNSFLSEGIISYINQTIDEDYYSEIWKLRIRPCSTPLHLVYSPLNGTGNIPVREIMRRLGNVHVDIVSEQENPDGHFPTCPYPNPEIREAMRLSIAKTLETGADLCFATDPDCDRLGAGIRVGNEVVLVSGNDMGILMLDYLCRNKKAGNDLSPVVVKTIVTTDMAAVICRKYGIELRNVLTGFKFIGEQIGLLEQEGHPERYLFGFEESYGYLSGRHVRDKDAVNAAVILCDMAAELKSQNKTLLDRLAELRREYGFFTQRLLTYSYEGENGSRQMAQIMDALRCSSGNNQKAPLSLGDCIDYSRDNTGLPKSNVLEFHLKDDCKVIVRPSGTEPKLKVYLFAHADDLQSAEIRLAELQTEMDCLCQP